MREEARVRFVLLVSLVFSLSAFVISLVAYHISSSSEHVRDERLESMISAFEEKYNTGDGEDSPIPEVLKEFLQELRVQKEQV